MKASIADWNSSEFQHLFHQHKIKWIFNPPAASHHGGTWEQLIRSVRKVLSSTLKEQLMDEESLHTVLCEAESIINGRPITKASNDPNDLKALTPNHLLLLKTKPNLPPGLFNKDDLYVRRRWRQVQYVSNLFGRGGSKNTCLSSRSVSGGPQLPETSRKEMWYCLWMTVRQGIRGLWDRSSRLFQTRRVLFAEFG